MSNSNVNPDPMSFADVVQLIYLIKNIVMHPIPVLVENSDERTFILENKDSVKEVLEFAKNDEDRAGLITTAIIGCSLAYKFQKENVNESVDVPFRVILEINDYPEIDDPKALMDYLIHSIELAAS